jgi:hypothetical protein
MHRLSIDSCAIVVELEPVAEIALHRRPAGHTRGTAEGTVTVDEVEAFEKLQPFKERVAEHIREDDMAD